MTCLKYHLDLFAIKNFFTLKLLLEYSYSYKDSENLKTWNKVLITHVHILKKESPRPMYDYYNLLTISKITINQITNLTKLTKPTNLEDIPKIKNLPFFNIFPKKDQFRYIIQFKCTFKTSLLLLVQLILLILL